jgi:hypothetical protein
MLSVLALPLFANPAVVDFDSGDYCAAQKAAIMTDLFRNERIRSGRADIADRRNMDRIIAGVTSIVPAVYDVLAARISKCAILPKYF